MEADLGGSEPHDLDIYDNYTYNVSPMFYRAFGDARSPLRDDDTGIRALNGMLGREAYELLGEAIRYMHEHAGELRELNPDNGWGDYEGALSLLQRISGWCAEAPDARLTVH